MEYILLDSTTVQLILICFILLFIAFCVTGNAWLKVQRECDLKDRQIRKERSAYNRLVYMYHRDTFKLPEADEDG